MQNVFLYSYLHILFAAAKNAEIWGLLYSTKLYIGMTKSKSSALSTVAPLIFLIHLLNGAQFLNATCVAWCPRILISLLSKM